MLAAIVFPMDLNLNTEHVDWGECLHSTPHVFRSQTILVLWLDKYSFKSSDMSMIYESKVANSSNHANLHFYGPIFSCAGKLDTLAGLTINPIKDVPLQFRLCHNIG